VPRLHQEDRAGADEQERDNARRLETSREPDSDSATVSVQPPARGRGLSHLVADGRAQFVSLFHDVRWIGPLFLTNAAASLLAAAGLAHHRTRPVAALAGIAISACALGSLVLSYGTGLFGWMEGGWRTAIALALVSELGAVLTLAAGLAGAALRVEGLHPKRA
jgi:hypothetical protein